MSLTSKSQASLDKGMTLSSYIFKKDFILIFFFEDLFIFRGIEGKKAHMCMWARDRWGEGEGECLRQTPTLSTEPKAGHDLTILRS